MNDGLSAYRWNLEQIRYFYKSGKITGEGLAVGGIDAGPLSIRVENGKDLKLMLTGQTGTIPAYLGLSSVQKRTEATMALPPSPKEIGTKEFGVVVGCNLADKDESQDDLMARPSLMQVHVYYVDRSVVGSGVQKLNTKWDCDTVDNPDAAAYCYSHHFYVKKTEWKTNRDYLFMVEFNIENLKILGNCYAVDCNGKIESTEIPSAELYQADPDSTFTDPAPVFQIGCICKGNFKKYQSLGTIGTFEADSYGTPKPSLDEFYETGLCNTCGDVDWHQVEVCEVYDMNEGKVTLDCGSSKIQIIYGNYGRTSSDVCRGTNSDAADCCDCKTGSDQIKTLCDDENTCELQAINSFFSDPCVGIYKYLEVQYKCV